MTEAEKAKKFLNYAGLEHLIELLVNMGVKGDKGLISKAQLTEITTKLGQVATSENLTTLQSEVAALKALIEADSDGAINKFNEIVAFLAGITDDSTLEGKLSGIATQISGKVDKVTGKGLSTNDYTAADKAEVAKVKNKANSADVYTKTAADSTFVKAADMTAITDAEIDALVAAQ